MESFLSLKKVNLFLSKYWLLVILIFSLPSVWALFVPGFYGASDDLHIAWLFEMDKTLKLGQIPPRFVPDLSFGFGYPLFNFVFPLPFYIGEIFHLLSLSFVDSIKVVFLISLVLSPITMFLFLREFTDEFLSLVGSLVYLYTPYRSNDVYNRGALGESLAFVFLPLFVLAVVKVSKTSSSKWIGIGALSLFALVLSHNITTYMFFPFVLLLSLIFIIAHKNKLFSFIYVFLLIMLGLFCGIYFWLPALLDSSLVKYDTVFNFVDHFPTLGQLFKPGWSYGASVAGPYDGMSFFLGLVNWMLVAAGIISLFFWKKYSKNQKIILGWSILSFGLALLMMNYRSTFFWQRLPLLPYFQFPWRFLIITTLIAPIFIISLEKLKFGYLISLGLLILVVILNLNVFKPHDFLGRQDDYYLKRYIPTPVANKEYLEVQEEYLRLPINTHIRPDQNYPALTVIQGEIKDQKIINDLSVSFKTSSSSGAIVDYNKYNFPGWYGFIDGISLGIKNGEPFSQIRLEIPKGQHDILIMFKETTFKLVLDLISLLSIIIAIALIFLPKNQLKKLINVVSNLNE